MDDNDQGLNQAANEQGPLEATPITGTDDSDSAATDLDSGALGDETEAEPASSTPEQAQPDMGETPGAGATEPTQEDPMPESGEADPVQPEAPTEPEYDHEGTPADNVSAPESYEQPEAASTDPSPQVINDVVPPAGATSSASTSEPAAPAASSDPAATPDSSAQVPSPENPATRQDQPKKSGWKKFFGLK